MEDQATLMESFFKNGELYTKTSVELIRLKTIGKSADVISSIAGGIFIFVSLLIFLLMLTIGAAIWIGSLMGALYLGFFIVACFYLFMSLIIYAFKNVLIKTPMCNFIINQFSIN